MLKEDGEMSTGSENELLLSSRAVWCVLPAQTALVWDRRSLEEDELVIHEQMRWL